MLTLIIGGSGSGKSELAENMIKDRFSGNDNAKLYYIATMKPYGEEGKKRIDRHRKLRQGKGFETIEQYENIEGVLDGFSAGKSSYVLLECMSNLCANEMFSDVSCAIDNNLISKLSDKIIAGIKAVSNECSELVIVTNDVFSDGTSYDESTLKYMELLANVNSQLTAMADEVWEVVVGIPINIKGCQ